MPMEPNANFFAVRSPQITKFMDQSKLQDANVPVQVPRIKGARTSTQHNTTDHVYIILKKQTVSQSLVSSV